MSSHEKGAPLPETIGACADYYAEVRALRLAMDKEVAEVKARETEIREHIINTLSKSADTGAAGLRYRAQVVVKDTPRLSDWAAFTAAVQQTGRFDLMQKRLSDAAIKELWADGVTVPGVELVKIPDVSITKI